MNKPLDGITVLDLTVALAGPFATLILAGLGAKVIKVENPEGGDSCRTNAPYLGADGPKLSRESGDDISVSALNRLRNKLGVTLNLKHPDARAVYADLVRKSDIVVENSSRGTMGRLGVGYDFAREVNPRIIYCSITGFGSTPDASPAKAMDSIVQALSGTMMTSGGPGDPPIRVGLPIGDLAAPLFGVIGILAALHQAQHTGQGQHIDVSMLGALTMMVAVETFDLLERCGIPQRTGLTVPRLAPFGLYRTNDGYVSICAPQETLARSLFEAMGRSDLMTDPRFRTRDARVENVRELDAIIGEFTSRYTNAEAVSIFERAGVPAAEVRNPDEAVRDPRVLARGETVRLEHPKFGAVDEVYGMGIPIKFSGATAGLDQPAPGLGEHNEAVYGGILGYSKENLERLKSGGVI
ncbi:MAG: CoA transferase [Acidobacteriia bacterium]|nr:CoA transferase [Terriglobia bacterium]